MDVPGLRRRLLAWYRTQRRDLPWRGRDTYGVWVSEAMLQQTRVDVATPYYLRWMERFPTVQALAAADGEDVLRAWAGLGYYSRARNLHAAARIVARDGWPQDLAAWRALPGVGPYTAAAVTSIALGQPNACVDGNVVRVVARLSGESADVATKAARGRIEALAQAWLAPKAPGDWNQAMMDLGATVCTPRAPRCAQCPVASLCAAKASGSQGRIPRKAKAAAPREEQRTVAIVRRHGAVLLVRPRTGLLAGMWAPPHAGPDEPVAAAVRRQAGVRVRAGRHVGTAVHQFSHRTWRMTVRDARLLDPDRNEDLAGDGTHDARWVPEAELAREAVPAAGRAALAVAGFVVAATKAKTGRASATP